MVCVFFDRYRALTRLEEDREVLILNHLGFLRCPTREYCPFRAQCMEVHMEKLLSTKAHRCVIVNDVNECFDK